MSATGLITAVDARRDVASYFEHLGESIRREWFKSDFDSDALPAIASARLAADDPSREIGLSELATWVLMTPCLPPQADLNAEFGEPPVTVYSHQRFRIDVICWNTATTNIHQHGFSGAFMVLDGSSLQAHFRFDADDRVNDYVQLGTLSLSDIRVLTKGAVEPIQSGNRLIHAVYHLDAPTLSLVVRTHDAPASRPQFDYFMPGFAYALLFEDPLEKRRGQMLRLLSSTGDRTAWQRRAIDAIAHSTLYGFFEVLSIAASRWSSQGSDYEELVRCGERQHGARARRVAAAAAYRWRLLTVHFVRRHVRNDNHRLFLAAALYSPNLQTVVELLRQARPNHDPRASIAQWTKELEAQGVLQVERADGTTILSVGKPNVRTAELLRFETSCELA